MSSFRSRFFSATRRVANIVITSSESQISAGHRVEGTLNLLNLWQAPLAAALWALFPPTFAEFMLQSMEHSAESGLSVGDMIFQTQRWRNHLDEAAVFNAGWLEQHPEMFEEIDAFLRELRQRLDARTLRQVHPDHIIDHLH